MVTYNGRIIRGKTFVVGPNVDTDAVIEAKYLTLNFKTPEDRRELGRHALERHPSLEGYRLVDEDQDTSKYRIIVAGENFGCGSSREQATFALAAAGVQVVIAQSFAPIYRENSILGRSLRARQCEQDLTQEIKTGDELELDLDRATLTHLETGKVYNIEKPPRELELLEEIGLVGYARKMDWM